MPDEVERTLFIKGFWFFQNQIHLDIKKQNELTFSCVTLFSFTLLRLSYLGFYCHKFRNQFLTTSANFLCKCTQHWLCVKHWEKQPSPYQTSSPLDLCYNCSQCSNNKRQGINSEGKTNIIHYYPLLGFQYTNLLLVLSRKYWHQKTQPWPFNSEAISPEQFSVNDIYTHTQVLTQKTMTSSLFPWLFTNFYALEEQKLFSLMVLSSMS